MFIMVIVIGIIPSLNNTEATHFFNELKGIPLFFFRLISISL